MGERLGRRGEGGARRLGGRALAGGLAVAWACGPTVSLDVAAPLATTDAASSSSTSGSSTVAGSDSSDGPERADGPSGDLPRPLLPGECDPGCTVDLPLSWAWDDQARPPSGELPLERRLVAMEPSPDGGWVLAEHRDGVPWLTMVDRDGALAWTAPVELGFEAEIIDLAFQPGNGLLVVGQGHFDDYYDTVLLGRFDPRDLDFQWLSWNLVYGTELVPPRVGAVIPLDLVRTAVLVTEAGQIGWDEGREWVEIFLYEHDYIIDYRLIDDQLASPDQDRRPLGVRLASGDLAVTIAQGAAESGYVVWLDRDSLLPTGAELLPGAPEAVALGPDDAVAVAGHIEVSPQQVVLQAAGLPPAQPAEWTFSEGVLTTSGSQPAVAIDAHGSTTIALRTTAGTVDDPRDEAVLLTRLRPDGTLAWSTTVPLALDGSSRPVGLAVTDDEGLVLAGIVDGRLHIERREQECRCD